MCEYIRDSVKVGHTHSLFKKLTNTKHRLRHQATWAKQKVTEYHPPVVNLGKQFTFVEFSGSSKLKMRVFFIVGHKFQVIWPSIFIFLWRQANTFCDTYGRKSRWISIEQLQKPAKLVWAVLMTRLHCFVAYVKFKFVYTTTTSKIGSRLLLASTTPNVLLGRGSKVAFNECFGVNNVFPSPRVSPNLLSYHNEVAGIPFGEVIRVFRFHHKGLQIFKLVLTQVCLRAQYALSYNRYQSVSNWR